MRLRQLHVATTILLALATIIRHGAAVICYQCNSEYDPRCGDPFDPYSLGTVNCSFQPRLEHLSNLEPTLCRKIRQKVYGKYRVVRGCGFLEDELADNKECLKRSGTHDVGALYCSCTTDLCNSANTSQPLVGLIVLLGFGALLISGILKAP
ncbi:PREDICTED: uncharacterized protein LOC105363551 [Ceratosolen solmsi marchali]|uniref:Uncharacterized protein LOC105363551 n=1 Tax=Ceratosolen solmsi marchali TaxID=326594 RepID=A0AAJ6YK86_9HYME|nr:PREDICTED: uncharacterized protein LOC105363551 [Ceratosolen solmsi marchali]